MPPFQLTEEETERILTFAKQNELELLKAALEELKERFGLTIADLVDRIKDQKLIGNQANTASEVGIIHLAVMEGHYAIFNYVFGEDGNNSQAATYGIYNSFGRRRSAVNISSSSGTPLSLAVTHKQFTMVKRLLSYGANCMANDRQVGGFIPLHHSANQGDVLSATYLLRHDASDDHINAITQARETPVIVACRRDHLLITKLLIGYGGTNLDKGAQSSALESAMHWAAYNHNPRMVSLLLNAGFPHDLVNGLSFTPIQIAQQRLTNWAHIMREDYSKVAQEFDDVLDEIYAFLANLDQQQQSAAESEQRHGGN